MRFKGKVSTEYRRKEKVLRLTGTSTNGTKAEVDIPMSTPQDFLLLLGVLFQADETEDNMNTSNLIPIRRLNMGVAREKDTNLPVAAIFSITVGELPIKFGAPLQHLPPERMDELDHHLQKAGELMQSNMPSLKHH